MFFHNFKYTLKTLLKNKSLIFWTFIFPIILATFYNLAFSNIEKEENFSSINIGIVNDENFNNNIFYKEAFLTLSDNKSANKIFNITYQDIETCKDMLDNKDIIGYIRVSDNKLFTTVSKNGSSETILKTVVDEINIEKNIYEELLQRQIEDKIKNKDYNIDYSDMYNRISENISNSEVIINDITSSQLSYTVIEFYNLIAMSALYGGIISIYVVNKKLANMGSIGKRSAISPIKTSSMLLGSLLASFIVELVGLSLLLVYMTFILKIDFGTHLPLILLLVTVSTLAGLTLGIFLATMLKTHEGAKTGILISITMIWCFLAGMTGMVMKYVIDKNIPIINKLNPASMITDGFYSLYYYSNLNRYWFDIISLVIFSFVMIFISLKGLRRKSYDSI